MAGISLSAAHTAAGGGLDAMGDAAGAMIHAADKYSRGLGSRGSGPRRAGAPDARSERARSVNYGRLPEGFTALRDVKDMLLLGRWPLLEDRMSPCYPARIIAAMQRRQSLGDQGAAAWLNAHAQACSGDPEAQRAFGRMCENGSHRVAADVQRAFFWYYRAGLQGDAEARRNAERLMHRSPRIAAATMAEPQLIHAGQWRITAHLSEHLHSSSVFELAEDGRATGRLVGNSRATLGTSFDAADAGNDAGDDSSASFAAGNSRYSGGWAFDHIGQVLTIIFESEGGERRWRGATWQIEMLGLKAGAVFGRDRRMVGYTLEHVPRNAASGCEP